MIHQRRRAASSSEGLSMARLSPIPVRSERVKVTLRLPRPPGSTWIHRSGRLTA